MSLILDLLKKISISYILTNLAISELQTTYIFFQKYTKDFLCSHKHTFLKYLVFFKSSISLAALQNPYNWSGWPYSCSTILVYWNSICVFTFDIALFHLVGTIFRTIVTGSIINCVRLLGISESNPRFGKFSLHVLKGNLDPISKSLTRNLP